MRFPCLPEPLSFHDVLENVAQRDSDKFENSNRASEGISQAGNYLIQDHGLNFKRGAPDEWIEIDFNFGPRFDLKLNDRQCFCGSFNHGGVGPWNGRTTC